MKHTGLIAFSFLLNFSALQYVPAEEYLVSDSQPGLYGI